MKRLLITGFDPFGGEERNPSWEVVAALPDRVGEYEVRKLCIPTVYGKAAQRVLEEAQYFRPSAILCVGLAGGRSAVTPERIAVNIRAASIADNEGRSFDGQRIDPEGAAAYFATVDADAMAASIREIGLPGAVSNSAGTFVCNDTLYTLLKHFHSSRVAVGFIHIPRIPEMGEPSLPLRDSVRALEAAIRTLP